MSKKDFKLSQENKSLVEEIIKEYGFPNRTYSRNVLIRIGLNTLKNKFEEMSQAVNKLEQEDE